MTSDDDFIKPILGDLYLVASYVATQPFGYAGFEVDRAKLLLHTVDVEALHDTLHSVLFVTGLLRKDRPLAETESQVEAAALRLSRLQRTIRMNQSQIQARMAA